MDILNLTFIFIISLSAIVFMFVKDELRAILIFLIVSCGFFQLLLKNNITLAVFILFSYLITEFFIKLNPKDNQIQSNKLKNEVNIIYVLMTCLSMLTGVLIYLNSDQISLSMIYKDIDIKKFTLESVLIFFAIFIWIIKFTGKRVWK